MTTQIHGALVAALCSGQYHEAIWMEPYKTLAGNKPCCGLNTTLLTQFLSRFITGVNEEQQEVLLNCQR